MFLWTQQVPSGGDTSEEARSTVQPTRETPIDDVASPAPLADVADDAPELTGLASRQQPGAFTPKQDTPFPADKLRVDYTANDVLYPTKGRAAALEAAGIWGRKSMQWSDSIVPVIDDGTRLGGDAFVVDRKPIQKDSSLSLQPADTISETAHLAAKLAEQRSRKAYSATRFAGLFDG